jgi:hypothetical protein
MNFLYLQWIIVWHMYNHQVISKVGHHHFVANHEQLDMHTDRCQKRVPVAADSDNPCPYLVVSNIRPQMGRGRRLGIRARGRIQMLVGKTGIGTRAQ